MLVKLLFDRHETITAEFRNPTRTMINGTPDIAWPTVATLSIKSIYWTGTSADRLVSEQYRPIISGVLIVDPEDYSVKITEDAKVTLNGEDYSIIYVENVANQNKVIQIPLKRFKSV